MPAEIIEQGITTWLERWTGQANGAARQESKPMVGVSIVKDLFRTDIDPNTAMSMTSSLAVNDLRRHRHAAGYGIRMQGEVATIAGRARRRVVVGE